MNLIDLFEPSFRYRADAVGLIFDSCRLRFGELDQFSDYAAAYLANECQVECGDRVGMYLGNSWELVVFYLAALKIGAITVPMNVLYRDRELTHLLSDAQPRIVLTDDERSSILAPLVSGSSVDAVVTAGGKEGEATIAFARLIDKTNGLPPKRCVESRDGALMIYTSGTTGNAKGALLSHGALSSNIISLLHCWQWTESDRFLLTLPLFHVHGLCNGLHGALASGCYTRVLERFRPDVVLDCLRTDQSTLFFGVPTMYERLLERVETGTGQVPTTMRLYVSGSAPLPAATFERFETHFGHQILERYGMSETVMITSNPYAGQRVQGTVGKPLPGIHVRIVGDAGRELETGEVGEINVRGPNLLTEYWQQPEKTGESVVNGWFRTGDLGCWNDDGYLIICGRSKELIITGGYNVYPQEVIDCLTSHEAVREAAVVGVPDPIHGERVMAYVVRDGEVREEQLIEYCRHHLARFKVPRSIHFRGELPRNAMGKLVLAKLTESSD